MADAEDDIRKRLTAAYAARVRGDMEDAFSIFAPNPSFRLNVSGPLARFATHCEDIPAIIDLMVTIDGEIDMDDLIVDDVLADGERAVVLWHMTATSRRTGKRAVFEIVDYMRFEDGKVTSFTEFFDTAKAAALLA